MLEFRPHHFLCTLGFQGKGYSDAFVANYQKIVDELTDGTPIRVAADTDRICGPCPNRVGTLCTSEEKIRSLDSAHARILGLRAGDTLTWDQAKKKIAENFTDERFEAACAPCGWKSLGVCKAALDRLKSGREE